MSTRQKEDVKPEFVSVGEIAAELQVTERFIRRLIADGELQAFRVGSRLVRVRRGDVDAMLRPVATDSSGPL
jgi:excisionase family DNA binding protein